MNKKKRLISFLLALVILLGTIQPATVQALALFDSVDSIELSSQVNETNVEKEEENLEEEFPLIANYLKSQEIKSSENGILTLLVEFEEGQKEEGLRELKKIPNLKVKYEYDLILYGAAIEIPVEDAKKVFELDEVKEAIESQPVEPAMFDAKKVSRVIDAWQNQHIRGNYDFDGRGMVIASVDSGVDVTHKDLRLDDGIFEGYAKIKEVSKKGNFTEKVPHGFNYCDGNFNMKDDFHSPHGQHIAGILAGNCTESDEQAGLGVRGVAPNAQILSYRIFSDANDPGDGYQPTSGDDSVYHAMEDAIKHGADVISLSIGDPGVGRRGDLYDTAIKNAQAHGVAVSISMGNYGTSASSNTFDNYTINDFGLKDTSMAVSGAANPDAIGVAAARNTGAMYDTLSINGVDYPVAGMGIKYKETAENFEDKEYDVVYVGDGSPESFETFLNEDEDFFEGKIVAAVRDEKKGNTVFEKIDRAMFYGAAGFLLINDITNKNRDTYLTELPISYEWEQFDFGDDEWLDEREDFYACGLSGESGKKLFNLSADNVERLKPKTDEIFKFKIETKEKKTYASFGSTGISGFSAWGPNNQLELKPDISAPGQDIVSLGNSNTYVQMSGTSMSQPFIAGVTALLYSKVEKDMQTVLIPTPKYGDVKKRVVPKKLEEPGKFTKSELAKFLMMSTAWPMKDQSTTDLLESSPRHQGAGMVDVEAAFNTNVFLSHNDRPSVSLKEIGEKTNFTVTLNNFSNKDQSFEIDTSKVITDEIRKVQKQISGGEEITVNELHPMVIVGSSITADKKTVTVPANSKADVNFTLVAIGKDIFAEGYIYFKSKSDGQPDLSIPYMGFLGDWGAERIIDPPSWDKDSKTGLTTILESADNGAMGPAAYKEVGIDGMDPEGKINPDMIAMGGKAVIPRIVTLRDANDYKISVVKAKDDSKQIGPENEKLIKLLRNGHFYKKYIHGHFLERWWYPEIVLTPDISLEFNGHLDNPDHEVGEVDFTKNVPEGQYYFKLEFRTKDHGPYQDYYIPLKVDMTDPKFGEDFVTYDKEAKTLTVKVEDNFGISYMGGALDGKKLDFKRVGNDYKTFVAENVNLSPSTSNEFYVEANDFANNKVKTTVELTKDSKLINYLNLGQVKSGESSILNLDVDDKRVDQVKATLNGEEVLVKENNGNYEIALKELKAINEIKISLYKVGKLVSEESHKIFRDDEKPTISDVKLEKVERDGIKVKITGKVKDNASEYDKLKVVYNNSPFRDKGTYLKETKLKEDGSFEILLYDINKYYAVFIYTIDEAGNFEEIRKDLGNLFDDYDDDEGLSHSIEHSVKRGGVVSHALPGDREVIYPGSSVAWIAFSPEQIGPHNNAHILPGTGVDNPDNPYRVCVEFAGAPGDTMTISSYNPVRTVDYIELEEPNLKEYPKTYKFSDYETVQLWTPVYSGFNVVNLKVTDEHGNTIVNRGYVYHMDMDGPELELFNVFMPEMPEGVGRPEIYFNSENYTLEGKVYDESNDVYISIGDRDVESWSLFGERNQERRFSHKGYAKEGEALSIKVLDRFGTKSEYKFIVKIDKDKPSLAVKGLENADRNSTLDLVADDNIKVWESKLLVNGKEYTGGKLSEYEVEGKEGQFFIHAYAKDLAGNTTVIEKTIGMEENIPELKLKAKKEVYTQEEAVKIENVFEIPSGITASYIEYADKYESSKLDDEWHDRDTLKPFRLLDKVVLRERGKNEVNVLLVDEFGRQQIHEYTINIAPETRIVDEEPMPSPEPEKPEEPTPSPEPEKPEESTPSPEPEKPEEPTPTPKPITPTISEKELLDSVSLKKTHYKSGEFKGIAEELTYPEGAKLRIKGYFETETPGKKTLVVEIEKDGIKVEKTFTIYVESLADENKPKDKDDIGYIMPIYWPSRPIPVENTRKDHDQIGKTPSKEEQTVRKTPVKDDKSIARISKFTDITNNYWAKDAISFCLEKGYFKGISEMEFAPERPIKRGDFVTVLGRIEGIDISSYKNSKFKDVSENSYYSSYINWAVEKGIVNGVGDNMFAPEESLSREQMAVIMANYLDHIGKNIKDESEINFKDSADISSWAKESVEKMAKKGLIKGMGDNSFSPKSSVTRAQVAQILFNLYK